MSEIRRHSVSHGGTDNARGRIEGQRLPPGKRSFGNREPFPKRFAHFGNEIKAFTERAPEEVIDENKRRREDFKTRQTQLQEMIANLG